MLSLRNVTSTITVKGKEINLLEDISLSFRPGQLVAIVGPSGCGKTTFIKTIAGMNDTSQGEIIWKGNDLEKKDFEPHELGYVPQFSIACEDLTVMENVRYSASLRVSLSKDDMDHHINLILRQTGLKDLADKPVKVLSGGQKRRLSLAIELTANPEVLLCDEVTSGLDLHSENEIVKLLKSLAVEQNRLVLSVTHSLENLEDYDAVVVLSEGRLCYHGPPEMILHYFDSKNASGIYHQLPKMSPEKWDAEWKKLGNRYSVKESSTRKTTSNIGETITPNLFKQTITLLERRWKILFRDRTQVFISLVLILGFPLLVMIFSDQGREPIRVLSEVKEANLYLEIDNQRAVNESQLKVGSAVSGIIMFQVILLCLTGSNNSAREISGERQIWEKEKLAGVTPTAYLLSKLMYLGTLVIIQSTVMTFLVESAWQFRGEVMMHWLSLTLINGAMTMICLAISSLLKNPAQSSLLAIYLVGFQLPLSGAILALPTLPEKITRSFISAYWAWSGSIESLQGNINNAVDVVSSTSMSNSSLCFIVLVSHIFFGLIFTIVGINRSLSN